MYNGYETSQVCKITQLNYFSNLILNKREVLCLELQYLRAITGSADGKIRIWNILNGDCIRVMRGNSRCDPILSMSIIDNRILMNTENNIILMEFEPVQFEYGSNRDETTETAVLTSEKQTNKKQQKQFYSTKRACRMELLQTPNTKLFNDDRKAAMNHSSRPLSNKNLRDAHLIHTILSTKENNQLIVNSAGHISESALNKRRSVMQSINAVMTTQSPVSISSALSYKANESSLNYISNEKENKIVEDLDKSFNKLPHNLNETKQFLRDQLKEIKQTSQKQDDSNYAKQKTLDSKSCIDAVSVNRHKVTDDLMSNSFTLRVLSARPTFDTKTKIKLKAQDLSDLKFISCKNGSNEDLLNKTEIQNNKKLNNPQILVTKVFESKESDLKTQNMYPMRVKSRIPNAKIIRPQTVPSKLITDNFVPNYLNNTATNSLPPANLFNRDNEDDDLAFETTTKKATVVRSKSALPGRLVPHNVQRPKTGKTSFNSGSFIEPLDFNNILSTNDHLNLKTYKEIDKIVDVISGSFVEPDKVTKEKYNEKDEIYKKFWLLRSTGKFHGSLLAQHKTAAPEIRE